MSVTTIGLSGTDPSYGDRNAIYGEQARVKAMVNELKADEHSIEAHIQELFTTLKYSSPQPAAVLASDDLYAAEGGYLPYGIAKGRYLDRQQRTNELAKAQTNLFSLALVTQQAKGLKGLLTRTPDTAESREDFLIACHQLLPDNEIGLWMLHGKLFEVLSEARVLPAQTEHDEGYKRLNDRTTSHEHVVEALDRFIADRDNAVDRVLEKLASDYPEVTTLHYCRGR